MPSSSTTRSRVSAGPLTWSLIADLVLIVYFATQGRVTHEETNAVAGALATAWPFLTAAAVGWLVTRAWRAPLALWPQGVVIWLVTVAGGLALRGLSGGGLALSFQVVTLLVLGALLLGHRLLGRGLRHWAARRRMN